MANSPKAYVDQDLVVASGTVVMPRTAVFSVVPVPVGNTPIKVLVRFTTNPEAAPGVQGNVIGNTVEITITNGDSHAGITLVRPVEIGWIGSFQRKLRMLVSSQLMGQPETALRLFAYTVTADGDADV